MHDNCGEGVPKRCFKISQVGGRDLEFCICYNQWPTIFFDAYPKHPGPDPGPVISIEGISREVMNEIKLLDMIKYLSTHLRSEVRKSIHEAVANGLKEVQRQLPEGIELE